MQEQDGGVVASPSTVDRKIWTSHIFLVHMLTIHSVTAAAAAVHSGYGDQPRHDRW